MSASAVRSTHSIEERTLPTPGPDGQERVGLFATAGLDEIAAAVPSRSEFDRPGSWLVILGSDAATTIGADSAAPTRWFTVQDEAEARLWLDTLARLYLATPHLGPLR